MTTQSSTIVQRVWNYCNVLRDDGISYGDYDERRLSVAREVESAVEGALVRAARLRHIVPMWEAVLKEEEVKQFGEYRTRRLVLEAWDKLEG
jgi:hypothetical protein